MLVAALCPMAAAAQDAVEDSLRINSGDPSNTEIPRFGPRQGIRRIDPTGRMRRESKLPKGYRAAASVDSLVGSIRIDENIDGYGVGLDVPMELDDFLRRRRTAMYTKIRDSATTYYEIKRAMSGSELSKLLEQATNLSAVAAARTLPLSATARK